MIAFAIPIFYRMQERFEKENGLRNGVESEKNAIFEIFKSTVKNEKYELALADIF